MTPTVTTRFCGTKAPPLLPLAPLRHPDHHSTPLLGLHLTKSHLGDTACSAPFCTQLRITTRLQSRAMLWNAWLVQKDESARIVICNALVVLCFKSAKDFRLDMQCTVAPPKCRAAQLPSCPIIYCPLPSPSTPPATSAPHLSAFTSSS